MKLSIRRAVLYRPFAATLLLFLSAYSNAFAAERIALVIGNATYSNAPPLNSPANDAKKMAETLSKLGFLLVNGKAHVNANKKEMAKLISTFRQKLVGSANGTTALFYFSGHGLGYKGENWLIPVDDGDLNYVENLKDNAIGSDSLAEALSNRKGGGNNILILDACRESDSLPSFDSTKSIRTKGFERTRTHPHTMVVYAAEDNTVAFDGPADGLSPFTDALLQNLEIRGRTFWTTLQQTAADVKEETNKKQKPSVGAMQLDWNPLILNPCRSSDPDCKSLTDTVIIPPPPPEHEKALESAENTNTILAYFSVVDDFPRTSSANIARQNLRRLEAKHFSIPPKGSGLELGEQQVKWCLRQKIWINDLLLAANNNSGLAPKFERLKSDFLSRCESYSAQKGLENKVERWIDHHRNWIVASMPDW